MQLTIHFCSNVAIWIFLALILMTLTDNWALGTVDSNCDNNKQNGDPTSSSTQNPLDVDIDWDRDYGDEGFFSQDHDCNVGAKSLDDSQKQKSTWNWSVIGCK